MDDWWDAWWPAVVIGGAAVTVLVIDGLYHVIHALTGFGHA